MPRKKSPPALLLHKPSGQARVRLNGKDVYLGTYDSPEAKQRYREILRDWNSGDTNLSAISVGMLCLKFLEHARAYYRKDGRETSEVSSILIALRFLTENEQYRNMSVRDFRTAALLDVRNAMVSRGFVRSSINAHVNRIRRMFTWGVERERVTTKCCVQPGIGQATISV